MQIRVSPILPLLETLDNSVGQAFNHTVKHIHVLTKPEHCVRQQTIFDCQDTLCENFY